mgnify:CR=1 FL=1
MANELKFCPRCGQPVEPEDRYCGYCGYYLEEARRKIARKRARRKSRKEKKEEEEYVIGGISSANLAKGFLRGYGVFVTNRRVIGVKARKKGLVTGLLAGFMGGALGAIIASKLGGRLTREEGVKLLSELEKSKDFELFKDNIIGIELKKPSLVKTGHIIFRTKFGDKVKIRVFGKKEYEELLNLMNYFKPEAITVI